MKCDRCDNEATVHELRVVSGKRHEMHLCESCAKAQGLAPQQMLTPLTALLGGPYVTHQSTPVAPAPASASAVVTVCPACSTSYAQFRTSGILGCATCYTVFEPQLTPLLARAHESGTQHTGKSPRRVAEKAAGAGKATAGRSTTDAKALAERVAQLKKRLTEAVAAEQYEKAAKLRDDLARLEGKTQAGQSKPPRGEGGGAAGAAGSGGKP